MDRRRGATPNSTSGTGGGTEKVISAFWRAIYDAKSLPVGSTVIVSSHTRNAQTGAMTPKGKPVFATTADDLIRYMADKNHNLMGDAVFFSPALLRNDKAVQRLGHAAKTKDTVRGVSCLWADIDLDSLVEGTTIEDIVTALEALPCPPSYIALTGGGVHPYWRLKDWVWFGEDDRAQDIADVEDGLRRLAWLVGGDAPVAQVAAYLRLPGSINWKRGRHVVTSFHANVLGTARKRSYTPDELLDMLDEAETPVLKRRVGGGVVKAKRRPEPNGDAKGFLAALAEHYDHIANAARMDIGETFAACTGSGAEMHEAIRNACASLVSCGVVNVDQVTHYLLEKLREQPYTTNWDWRAEERKIRKATQGWIDHLEKIDDLPEHVLDIGDVVEEGSDEDDDDEPEPDPPPAPERPRPAQDVDKTATPRARRRAKAEGERAGAAPPQPDHGRAEEPLEPDPDDPSGHGRAEHARRPADDERVINLKQARAERAKPGPKGDKAQKKSARIGLDVFESLHAVGRRFALIGANPHWCRKSLWSGPVQLKTLDNELASLVEVSARLAGLDTSRQMVNEVVARMKRSPGIFWHEQDVKWDAHRLIPAMDEDGWTVLIDWKGPEGVRVVRRATPEDWCTRRVPLTFEEGAECPRFERFVKDIFQDRNAVIQDEIYRLLGEICGTSMVAGRRRELRTLLYLLGPSYTGKSQLLEAIGEILGKEVITTPLVQLVRPHGTQDFLCQGTWLLHEAHEGSQVVGETSDLKRILSGEPFQVNPKNLAPVTFRFEGLAAFATNNPARFRDTSDAVVNRTHLLETRHVFERETPIGVVKAALEAGYPSTAEYLIAHEGPGILNWLLEGLTRAWERGYLGDTGETRQARNEMRDDANQLRECMRECCEPDPDGMVDSRDFKLMVAGWWAPNGRDQRMPTDLGSELRKLHNPKIAADRKELRKTTARYYCGFRLSEAGMYAWDTGCNDAQAKDTGAGYRMTARKDVNQRIPDDWHDKPLIRRMRDAHRTWPEYLFTDKADREAIDRLRVAREE